MRAAGKTRRKRVGVRETRLGKGVFALRPFSEGELIGAIRGRVVDDPLHDPRYSIDYGNQQAFEPRPPFRFLNHSCVPNAAIVYIDGDNGRQLLVQALRPIKADEELTVDYAWPATFAIPCLCGAAGCRGWVVSADQLALLRPSESA